MTPLINFSIVFGILGVLSGVSYAIPLPADDPQAPVIPAKLPFSLELEPPLPDSSSGTNKATVLPLRDSYGNPIPPSVLGVDPDYGLDTPKNTITIKKTVNTQGINFPIPSYASGITEIHRPSDGLLPPFKPTGGDALLSSSTVAPAVPLPVTDLIPPLPNSLTKDDAINEISGTLTFNTPIPDIVSPSLTASVSTATTAISSLSTTTTTSEPIPVPILVSRAPRINGEKYTGGFGGAPGILGEQKQIGYAVTTTPTPFAPPITTPTTTTTPAITTPIPPTTTITIVTSTLPPVVRERGSFNEPSRIPIGVSPPSPIIFALPALSKVILPPFETYEQLRQNQDLYTISSTTTPTPTTTTTPTPTTTTKAPTTTTTTTTTTQRPTTTTTTTTIAPTTTKAPTTTTPFTTSTVSILVQPIDLESIPFPTTPPLEDLIKGTQSKPNPSGIPTLSTILLPPPYSSNARPFEPPQSSAGAKPEASLTVPPSDPSPSTNSRGQDFLSLSFGFENAPTNESSQKTAIGTALQERFGTSFSSQALPSIINDLEPVKQPAKPSVSGAVPGLSITSTQSQLPTIKSASPLQPVIVPAAVPVVVPAAVPAVVPAVVIPSGGSVTGEPGKYTGGFGGAPGVLGEQKKPGFGIKPEAGVAAVPAILPTTTTTTAAPIPVVPVISSGSSIGEKYTGGFGGPPGVLTPYDNVKKDS